MRGGPAVRRSWFALAAAACLALALLAAVLRSGPVLALDGGMHAWVVGHRNAILTWLAVAVTSLGSSFAVGTAVFVVVVLGTSRRRDDRHRHRQAVAVMVVLAAGSLLRFGLSVLVGRLRPPQRDWAYPASGYAWPSGHTTVSTIGATLLVWWLVDGMGSARKRAFVILVALLYIAAVGSSRVYLGVHWPSDVVAGWLFALCWLALAASLLPPSWRPWPCSGSRPFTASIETDTETGAHP